MGNVVWVFVANFIRFQQCKNFENLLRYDKVTESLKVGTFFETQCRSLSQLLVHAFDVLQFSV